MRNVFVVAFVFMSGALNGQGNISIHDFLPQIFYTRQSLIDHYQDQKLSYEAVMHDLEQKSDDGVKIIFRDTSQITYTQTYGNFDTITCHLTFNKSKQLVKGKVDYKDCYNRTSGSDVPEPFISDIEITYNHAGQIDRESGHCATNEFSTLTNYYYNRENELDSITFREGYVKTDPYRKIIFMDTAVRSGELKSTMALILNTRFDYTDWLKNELGGIRSIKKDSLSSSTIRSRYGENSNYVYEFDSLGRITSLSVLDQNAALTNSLLTVHGCDFCEENCESPSVFEFYYEKDKIARVECTSFSGAHADNTCRCRCLIQMKYRKEKIKEINFYAALNDNYPVLVNKWTKQKGFQAIPDNTIINSDNQRLDYLSFQEQKQAIDSSITGFQSSEKLYYAAYEFSHESGRFAKNQYYVRSFESEYGEIFSDTLNGIVRYMLVQGDCEVWLYYTKGGQPFKIDFLKTFGGITSYYLIDKNKMCIVDDNENQSWCTRDTSSYRAELCLDRKKIVYYQRQGSDFGGYLHHDISRKKMRTYLLEKFERVKSEN